MNRSFLTDLGVSEKWLGKGNLRFEFEITWEKMVEIYDLRIFKSAFRLLDFISKWYCRLGGRGVERNRTNYMREEKKGVKIPSTLCYHLWMNPKCKILQFEQKKLNIQNWNNSLVHESGWDKKQSKKRQLNLRLIDRSEKDEKAKIKLF